MKKTIIEMSKAIYSMSSIYVIALMMFAFTTACTDSKSRLAKTVADTAKKSVSLTVDDPDNVTISSVTIPDSVIDRNWFGKKDAQLIMQAMQISSKQMMQRMSNLTDESGFEDEMLAMPGGSDDINNAAQELMRQTYRKDNPKGIFTGWRVLVNYITKDRSGKSEKWLRWCFLDPEGIAVIKSFDIRQTW